MSKLDTLWQYQQADLATDDFERKAKNSPRRVKLLKLRDSITEMQERLQEVKDKIAGYQTSIEGFQKDLEAKDKEAEGYIQKLDAIDTEDAEKVKELSGQLQATISSVRSIEKQLNEMMNTITSMDKQTKEIRMKAMKARAEYTQLKGIYDEEYKKTSADLTALRQKRNAIGEKVDPALLAKYKNIKAISTPPMAKLNGDQCAGCHMSLPSVTHKSLKEAKKVVECDNCGRILYQP